jgi:hypothetical protein
VLKYLKNENLKLQDVRAEEWVNKELLRTLIAIEDPINQENVNKFGRSFVHDIAAMREYSQ